MAGSYASENSGTSSANRTPVLGWRRRCSAERGSLRSSDVRLAGSDMCLRREPSVGDDHARGGGGSTDTGDSDSHAESQPRDDASRGSVGDSGAPQPAAKVGDGTSAAGLSSSYIHITPSHARHIYNKQKGSTYAITERRVPELIPVLGSQHAGEVSHKPDGRLPLLSARPTVTPATLKRAATSLAAW